MNTRVMVYDKQEKVEKTWYCQKTFIFTYTILYKDYQPQPHKRRTVTRNVSYTERKQAPRMIPTLYRVCAVVKYIYRHSLLLFKTTLEAVENVVSNYVPVHFVYFIVYESVCIGSHGGFQDGTSWLFLVRI